MPNRFASGKYAIAMCDRCGQQYKLKELKKLVIKQKTVNIKVCPECWEPDQPQLSLGLYPVDDPQALREPRPDVTYRMSGLGPDDIPEGGSRVFQWGWAPVGGSRFDDVGLTPNDLVTTMLVNNVTVTIS
jgi:hypothetical protein